MRTHRKGLQKKKIHCTLVVRKPRKRDMEGNADQMFGGQTSKRSADVLEAGMLARLEYEFPKRDIISQGVEAGEVSPITKLSSHLAMVSTRVLCCMTDRPLLASFLRLISPS